MQEEAERKTRFFLAFWAILSVVSLIILAIGKADAGNTFTESLQKELGYFGRLSVLALAFTAVGGLVGFLFGVPPARPAPPGPATGGPGAASTQPIQPMRPTTSIEQISEWLTKVLVGAGLAQLGTMAGKLEKLGGFFSPGLGEPTPPTAMTLGLILNFTVLGFFTGHLLTRLFLNRAFDDVENRNRRAVVSLADQSIARAEVKAPPGAEAAARKVMENSPDLGSGSSPVKLVEDAKVFYMAGLPQRSEEILRRADNLKPQDPETLFNLAYMIVQQENPSKFPEAAQILERIKDHPGAKAAVWKLLGYCYLFQAGKAKESEKATQKYLENAPGDPGGLLNLACAYGQQGHTEPANVERLMKVLRHLFREHPSYVGKVRSLTAPGQDFEGWEAVEEFNKLVLG